MPVADDPRRNVNHAEANTARGPAAGNPDRPRLLLVEDEDPFREMLHAFLEVEGFDVCSVPDGRRGVRWLRANAVDVVITDLYMPDADGIELLMELRKARSTVPIIVMSGGVDGEMAGLLRAAELLGARLALAKPFPLRQLVTAVHGLLPPALQSRAG